MIGTEVLAAYHYQPNLERRNHLLKGPQDVAPVYLESAHRIEALLLCHFLAMLTEALIEREIRTSMSDQGLAGIALYPELRNCPAASAPRILQIFNDVQRHQLINDDGQIVQTFQPNSPCCKSRSWTSSTSQPASTPQPTPAESEVGPKTRSRSAERQVSGVVWRN